MEGLVKLAEEYNSTHPISFVEKRYMSVKHELVISLWARGVKIPHELAYGKLIDDAIASVGVGYSIERFIDPDEYTRVRAIDNNWYVGGFWFHRAYSHPSQHDGKMATNQNIYLIEALNQWIFFTHHEKLLPLVNRFIFTHREQLKNTTIEKINAIIGLESRPGPMGVVALTALLWEEGFDTYIFRRELVDTKTEDEAFVKMGGVSEAEWIGSGDE